MRRIKYPDQVNSDPALYLKCPSFKPQPWNHLFWQAVMAFLSFYRQIPG